MLHYNTIDRCGLVVQEYNENLTNLLLSQFKISEIVTCSSFSNIYINIILYIFRHDP